MNNFAQIRAIRNYAHSLHVDDETGARLWCERGLAEQWRLGQ